MDVYDNNFVRALSAKFKVNVLDPDSGEDPDLLFYSALGCEHYKYSNCMKIYYTGENDIPNFNECDYALSFHNIEFDGRHMRYPLYMSYEIDRALCPPQLTDEEALRRDFCSLLMRNNHNCDKTRLEIIDAVESVKPLAYGGTYRNNVGGRIPWDGKIEFIANYKFNLALENSALPGYVTEKIVEPFAAPTVPVYWGAPDVDEDFNPEAFINVGSYTSIDKFIADLKEIDSNDDRYLSILRAPRLKEGKSLEFEQRLSDFLCSIADNMKPKRSMYAWQKNLYRRNRIMNKTFSSPKLLNLMGRILKIK